MLRQQKDVWKSIELELVTVLVSLLCHRINLNLDSQHLLTLSFFFLFEGNTNSQQTIFTGNKCLLMNR